MYNSRARSARLSRLRQRTVAGALIASLAAPVIALGSASPAFAAAGDLDTTLSAGGSGAAGIRQYDVYNNDQNGATPGCIDCVDKARGVVFQPDGKIVVAGEAGGDGSGYYVARYNADGSPDTSFGNVAVGPKFNPVPGYTKVGPVSPNPGGEATSVAIDAQGRVYAAGFKGTAFMVARFTATGAVDTSFAGGEVTIEMGGFVGADEAQAVAIDSNGKVVVAGQVDTEIIGREPPYATGAPDNLIGVVRLNENGTLDLSFDGDGKATFQPTGVAGDFTTGGNGFKVRALTLDPTNRPVLVGFHESGYQCITHTLPAPATPAGQCDSESSNRDGTGVYRFPAAGGTPEKYESWTGATTLSAAYGVSMQAATGKILVAGTTAAENFSVMRLNSDLTVDSTFGTSGIATQDVTSGTDTAVAITEDAAGRIVVAGNADYNGIAWNAYGVVRFAADGKSSDITKSTNFSTATSTSDVYFAQAFSVAVAPNGRILVSGRNELVTGTPDNHNSVLVAYKPEAPTAPLTIAGSSGNQSAQVTFTAPTTNISGATKVTYTATAAGGGSCTATTPTLQCTITGLNNNQAYTVTATYATAGGTSPTSNSVVVTPSPVPGAPTGVTASIANDATLVAWSAAPDNGSAITGYTATASPGGQSCATSGLSCTITGLSNGTTYSVSVKATNGAGQGVASTAVDVKPGLGKYVALSNPSRFLDTRNGIGRSGTTKPAAGSSIDLQITGVAGIPADALAVVLNVTATGTTGAGYITAYPSGRGQPNASSVNIDSADETIANLVTVKIGNGGKVTLYTYEGAHLIADVAGYYVPAATATSGRFTGLTPSRLLDTRTASRPGKNSVTGVQVLGRGGVPSSGVSAVVLNLTGVNPSGPGYVTAYASGLAQPTASNINLDYEGQIIANQVIVPVGADGRINLYTYDAVDLLVDVAGYYSDNTASSSGTGIFVAVNPSRILDTRPTRQAANTARQVQVAGNGGTPSSGVGGAVFNLTAVDPLALGYATAYPSGVVPTASNLNINYLGQIISNQTTVGLSNGAFNLYSYQAANLIVDLSGFFTA